MEPPQINVPLLSSDVKGKGDDEEYSSDVERARARSYEEESILAQVQRSRGSNERVPIRIKKEEEADALVNLLLEGKDQRVWVKTVASTVEGEGEEETGTTPVALFRFLRRIQAEPNAIRVLYLNDAPVVGEAFKALMQMLRDSCPPLEELYLENVGMNRFLLAEVSLAAIECTSLKKLSVARNALPAEGGLPLAQLIRRSRSLAYLDVSGNQMRAKGILDLIVAVRDKEILVSHFDRTESVVVTVSKMNVVVTLYPSAQDAQRVHQSQANLTKQFTEGAVPLEQMVPPFELIVSDNTLTSNETAVLILTEMQNAKVVGIPETVATFTSPEERGVVTGYVEPDPRTARLEMRKKVERNLESGDGSSAIVIKNMEEALMLAQVLYSLEKASVHINYAKGIKHKEKSDFLEAFLAGSSDNGRLQAISLGDAGVSKAEMVPLADALNWVHPMLIRKIDIRNNFIGVFGAQSLAAALKRNETVTTLDVSNNALGIDGCRAIFEALRHHKSLDRLSIGNNGMRAEGAYYMKDMLSENTILRRLDIQKNKLGPKGASLLARALIHNVSLNRLDLSDNGIRLLGFVELMGALKVNTTLLRICLADNAVGQVGESAFVEMLQKAKNVVVVDLSNVGINITKNIEDALEKSATIRSLGSGVKLTPAVNAVLERNLHKRIELEQAIEKADMPTVEALLTQAPLGFFMRKTLLHHAVVGGPVVMRRLLEIPTIATQVLAKDRKGQTALHEAALFGSVDCAHLLLQAGANAAIRDWEGKSPADLSSNEAFKRLMHAEESYVLAFRQRNVHAVGSGDYYTNTTGIKSPLQAWQSERPIEYGSRYPGSSEPSHPFKYMEDQVAPIRYRSGYFSLDTLQMLRDVVVFVILIAWMYELLEVPFRFGFAPQPIPGGYWALALFMDIVFMAWFFWSLAGHRTSWDPDSDSSEFDWLWASESKKKDPQKRPLELKSRRRKRRQKLTRHWTFYIMLAAAIPWDFVLFIIWCASGPTHIINPIVLDVIQGLRLMRCGMFLLSQNHFQTVAGALNLSWSVLEMCKMAIWFFYLINFFSCIYFFSGRIAIRYNYPSWITIATFLDIQPGQLTTQTVFTQYQFTMYFVCFGVTNSPFFQANWFEAFLWICEILGLGLVFVAFIFGTIIDRIAQLREERAAMQECQDKIVEMCGDLNLPDKVERKIVKKWLQMGSHGLSVEINSIGEMISPLSKDLRKEVTLHIIWNWIDTYQQRRDELAQELDERLVDHELDLIDPGLVQRKGKVQLPAMFPFTNFWHSWLKKLCFHPERYISFLVSIVQSVDQKFLLADTMLYDFEEPSSNLYCVISGSITLRLGRTRLGKEVVDATLYPGDWFGWEALGGFKRDKETSYVKPPRRSYAKAIRNTTVWVVPGSKFRKLYLHDNEARFDLEDQWLQNMDAECLAWTLHHFPPEKLSSNELVSALESPKEKEDMKKVLLNSMLRRGEKEKTMKKDVGAAVKVLSRDLSELKKTTMSELRELKDQNIALKESLQKSMQALMELLQTPTGTINL